MRSETNSGNRNGNDLFGPWSHWQRGICLAVTILVLVRSGPGFSENLRPRKDLFRDFFQEWASARNWIEGRPVYAPLDDSVRRYLPDRDEISLDRSYWKFNTHPPTSVLLLSPLARMSYLDAFLVWSLVSIGLLVVSIGLVFHELRIRVSVWSVLVLITLGLLANPLRQQMNQGQLSILILLLVVLAWVADRRQRPYLAGTMVAMAAAMKLFPVFLFLYFLLLRRWRSLLAGGIAGLFLFALTALAMELATFEDYLQYSVPWASTMRGGWLNASVPGFWNHLFNPGTVAMERIEPLIRSVWLDRIGAAISCAAVIGAAWWASRRVDSTPKRDLFFGIVIVSMLVVSPVTWDHYFVILLLPTVLVWWHLPARGASRWLFGGSMALLWTCAIWFWYPWIGTTSMHQFPATPRLTLVALSLHCYALVVLLILNHLTLIRIGREEGSMGDQPALHRVGRDDLAAGAGGQGAPDV